MSEIWQDVRFALRLLRRERAFTTSAIFVLGIGIGINNMFFTILYAHTMRGLPIAGADRIVFISTFDDRSPDRAVSYADFLAIRGSQGLADVAAFTSAPVTIAGHSRAAERLDASFVSANAFALVGAAPERGRGFRPEDDGDGGGPVALLGAAVWRARFGGDEGILGQAILVNGAPVTVVGIAPDATGLPTAGDLWMTLRHAPGALAQPRDIRTLRLIGRMKDGTGVDGVRAEVEGIVDRLTREGSPANRNLRARVVPINERYFGRLGDPAWRAFIAASILVALISCANAANLMIARFGRRARELAIRASIGAQRGRIFRQLLIEGIVLAAAGGIVGLGVSLAGVQVFRTAIPERTLPYWVHYTVDARVLAALIAVSMTTVVLFAVLPAIRASTPDLNSVLKDAGRAGPTERSTGRWSTAFLVAEFALTVVLLAQVVVSFRASGPSEPSDRVLDTRSVVTATVTVPAAKYATAAQRLELVRRLQERVATLPGVAAVSAASAAPLSGAAEARLQGPNNDSLGPARTVTIEPRYFETLAVPLRRGRDFTAGDGESGQVHAIVNERFADRFFAGRDPIGQRIALAAGEAPSDVVTIIGVAANVRQRPLPEADPIVYLPYRASAPSNIVLMVRGRIDVAALAPLLRREVLALDPLLPMFRIQTLSDVVRNAQWNARLSHRLVLMITFIAVALSTVGLYAVTAHGVARRTQEIGVRMALGARPRQVLMVVVRRVLLQVTLGFAAGIVCTLAWERMFSSGRVDLSIVNPAALAAIAATLVVAALIACYVPARRAIHLDPVAAIRGE